MGEQNSLHRRTSESLLSPPEIYKINNEYYATVSRKFLKIYSAKNSGFDCYSKMFPPGTSLDIVNYNDHQYLVLPDNNKNLTLVNINSNNDSDSDVTKLYINYNFSHEISNLSNVVFQRENYLVLVHERQVNVMKLINLHEIEHIFSFSVSNRILDAKLNRYEQNNLHLGFTKSKYEKCIVLVKNIETKITLYQYVNDKNNSIDNFVYFEFIANSKILLMDRTSIKIINYVEKILLNTFEPDLPNHNFLNAVKNISEYSYVAASKHTVLETDIRKIQCSYTPHRLLNIPSLMDMYTENERISYLCLASNVVDDIVAFSGNPEQCQIPYMMSGTKSCLKRNLMENPYLLMSNLVVKSNYNISGLKLVEYFGDVFLYWSTTAGDVFKQKLNNIDTGSCNEIVNIINETELKSSRDKKLNVTNIADLSMAKFLLNKSNNEHVKTYSKESKKNQFLSDSTRYQEKCMSVNDLVDSFNILWKNNDQEEAREKFTVPEFESEEKVTRWIHSTNFNDNVDVTEF